jgi:signal transduction histidine kinase
VSGQGELLSAVLETLTENALQHGATLMTLRAQRQGNQVLLDVEDNGSGIAQGNRVQVFEAFFTTERDRGGTGLGLTIAAALMKQLGGELSLLDGTPTTFRLALPIAA